MHDLRLAFHYDRTDGFYTGFETPDLCQITGEPLLPAFATFQRPPIEQRDGADIAVFVNEQEGWKVMPNTFWNPNIQSRGISLGNTISGELQVIQLEPFKIQKYKGVPRLINTATISFSMSGRLAYMQTLADNVTSLYGQCFEGVSSEVLHHFKYAGEEFVTQMKRFVDEIFMHEWLLLECNSSDFVANKTLKVLGVNEVGKLQPGPTKIKLEALIATDPEFFKTLTDLRNSFAHHLCVASSYQLMGADFPTINTLSTRNGKLNDVELIEVYVEDLLKSFNRFVSSVFVTHDRGVAESSNT